MQTAIVYTARERVRALMDDTREWLIELLRTTEIDEFGGRKKTAGDLYLPHVFEKFADRLIKSGVRIVRKG